MSERRGRPAISRGAELKRLACAAMMAAAAFGRARIGLAEGPDRPRCDTQAQADAKSIGCLSCHTATDSKSMHTGDVILSCVDCHGGNGLVRAQGGPGSPPYEKAQHEAHVLPKNRELWKGTANPQRSYTALLDEDLAFVRFVNPGDLRAATLSCAPCHRKQVGEVQTSPMTHAPCSTRSRSTTTASCP